MTMKRSVFQFKITLLGTNPKVWRRFRVQSDITFRQLHNVVQIVMGWENYHLYAFAYDWHHFTEYEMGAEDKSPSHRLNEFIQHEGTIIGYEYDFGDRWQHHLFLEKILTTSRKPVPSCTAGRRACPPEDCGGIWGYTELAKAMKIKRGRRYREFREWHGGYFDPEEFDIEAVNSQLSDSELWK
jgi:hypothetical protein